MKTNSALHFSLTLLLLCGISTALVAGAFTFTKDEIAQRKESSITSAFKEVFPQGKDLTKIKPPEGSQIKDIECSTINGKPNGYIYTLYSKGYGGNILIMVGFSYPDKKITGIKILEQTETPGLGAKCTEKDFTEQFKNKDMKSPLELSKNSKNEEIQAITAATITSRAVVNGVNEARRHFREHFANNI